MIDADWLEPKCPVCAGELDTSSYHCLPAMTEWTMLLHTPISGPIPIPGRSGTSQEMFLWLSRQAKPSSLAEPLSLPFQHLLHCSGYQYAFHLIFAHPDRWHSTQPDELCPMQQTDRTCMFESDFGSTGAFVPEPRLVGQSFYSTRNSGGDTLIQNYRTNPVEIHS